MGEVRTHSLRALPGIVLVVALALLISASALAFGDVPGTYLYSEAIVDLSQRGIINGFDDGTFGPTKPVTRQQFAKMIVLTLDIPVSETLTCDFTDVAHIPGELYPYHFVAAAANHGITKGFTVTLFKPYNNITRAQAITMVVRALDALHPGTLHAPGADFSSSWGTFSPEHGANAAKAEANGLLEGLTPPGSALSSVNPLGFMSRGEVAQVLHNVLELLDDTAGPPTTTPPTTTPPTTTPPTTTPPTTTPPTTTPTPPTTMPTPPTTMPTPPTTMPSPPTTMPSPPTTMPPPPPPPAGF